MTKTVLLFALAAAAVACTAALAGAQQPVRTNLVGSVQAIDPTNGQIILQTDDGKTVKLTPQPGARFLRLPAGESSLAKATPITANDIELGDRMLARGEPSDDKTSMSASTIVISARPVREAIPKAPATAAAANRPGPFGFGYGMTTEQVVRLLGKQAVKEAKDDRLLLATAPKPHPAFEEYMLFFSPKQGMLKIVAIGKTIQTNGFGEEARDAFIEIRDALQRTYGAPNTHDFLKSGSIWGEPRDWMGGLLKNERVLAEFWDVKSTLPSHITSIELEAKALSSEEGYLRLAYEFVGWEEYVDSTKAKEETVF